MNIHHDCFLHCWLTTWGTADCKTALVPINPVKRDERSVKATNVRRRRTYHVRDWIKDSGVGDYPRSIFCQRRWRRNWTMGTKPTCGSGRLLANQNRPQPGSFWRPSAASSVSAESVIVMKRSNGSHDCAGDAWRENNNWICPTCCLRKCNNTDSVRTDKRGLKGNQPILISIRYRHAKNIRYFLLTS